MKKTLLSLGVMLVWASSAFAGVGSETVTMPADVYKAILERLDSLQKRVDDLEQEKSTVQPTREQYDKLTQDVDNIYDTLDEVETKTLQDRINFGAELRTRVDNYSFNNMGTRTDLLTGAQSTNNDGHDDNNWSNRFRLNMDAEISNSLSFHGRLAVYKNWGDSDYTETDLYVDINQAHRPGTTSVKLDRAYIDWIPQGMPVPLALTIGRHPSTEGPPYELKENRLRQSTYPALLIDLETDGIVGTIGLEQYTGLKNSAFRLAYGIGYHSDFDNSDSFSFLDDDEAGDSTMFASFLESEMPGLPGSLAILSYVHIDDVPSSFRGPNDDDGNPANVNLGDLDLYGIHLQVDDLKKSGFDLFVSWGASRSDPNGKFATYPGYGDMGLLTADGQDRKSGSSLYAGLRYKLPIEMLNHPKIGFEYNHGSKYWISMGNASSELYNKLATRGDVYEIYYIQPVSRHLFFRAGYTSIDYDYTLSGYHTGQPVSTDAELENYYLLMDCRF